MRDRIIGRLVWGRNLMWHYTTSVRPANPPIGTLVDNIRGNPDVMPLKRAVFRGGSSPHLIHIVPWTLPSPHPNGISIGSAGLIVITDRQTDRPRYSVYSNKPHLARAVMRPNNIWHRFWGTLWKTSQMCSVFSEREHEFTFAICCRPSVCHLSVTGNARAPYPGGCNFGQFFYDIWYLGHPLTCTENFMEIVPGEPLRQGS